MNATHRRILLFFVATYAFSWFANLAIHPFPSDAWPFATNPVAPVAAALLVIWVTEGRDGLAAWWHRIIRFRAPLRVYATAVVAPLGIVIGTVGLSLSVDASAGPLPNYSPLEYVMYLPLVLLGGPAPEELTFRGFGQHELQETMSPLAASLWIGLGIVIWHAPAFIAGSIPWPIAFALLAVSVVYAWLYRMGGSVWPLVILHIVQNYFGAGIYGAIFVGSGRTIWIGFFTVFYVVWAALIVWRFGPSLDQERQPA